MAKPNPILQQLIKGIAAQSTVGRTNISWATLNESRKKNKVREAAPEVKKGEPTEELPELDPAAAVDAPDANAKAPTPPTPEAPAADSPPEGDLPDLGAAEPEAGAEPAPEAPPADPEAETDDAKAGAEKANAELEKAKAEKDQAEQELEQNAYVKLNTPGGLSFLLRKLVGHAVKTNMLDSLASEFAQKLKITTPEDFSTFSDDMIPYKNIPGMAEFLSSVQSLASQKQPAAED